MKRRLFILILLVAIAIPSAMAQRRSRGYWHIEWTIEKGDTIPLVHILPIYKYSRKPDMRRYQRLVRQVKKCYPLAKQARIEMENMEQQLLALGHEIAQENCDLYIINTCTVTAVADRKNRTLIRRLRRSNGSFNLDRLRFSFGCVFLLLIILVRHVSKKSEVE